MFKRSMMGPLLATLLLAADGHAAMPRTDITTAGAVGDGKTLCTRAIQNTIDNLARGGGGTVLIPKGQFLSGAVFLKPGVNLQLDAGAELLGSTKIDDYPAMSTRIEGHTQIWRPALVNANGCDGLRIGGEGTIRGGGRPYWEAFWNRLKADKTTKNLDVDRPRNIFIRDSRHITLQGISLRDSGFWNLHLYRCQDVSIDKLDIRSPLRAPSTDGIDLDSCQDVTVRGCYISVDDDDIALKGSKGPDAGDDTQSPPVQRIHVTDCTFGLGNGVVTLGSEACHVKGLLLETCRVENAADGASDVHRNTVLKLKLRPDTPQDYQDLTVRNMTLDFTGDVISIEGWTQYFDLHGRTPPAQSVKGIVMENIRGNAGSFGRIKPPAKATVEQLAFKNLDLKLTNAKVSFAAVKGVSIEDCRINGAPLTADAKSTGAATPK
ncbi:MAG: glycoside hydrolase family 28 protein [Tepidisphaeraceae bacterium]